MELSLKKLETYTLADFQLMAKWNSDTAIMHFFTVRKTEDPLQAVSAEFLMDNAVKNTDKSIYFILSDQTPIGEASITAKFPYLASKDENVAWISLLIGEKAYLGQGLGRKTMALLENECRALHYRKIELGVFRFNERAHHLYQEMGYEEIEVNAGFTYHDGKWHDDIRMIKTI